MTRNSRRRSWWLGLGVAVLSALGVSAQAADPVELRFTVWDGDQALNALRSAVGEFEQKYPNIKVRLEPVSYGDYFNKLLVQIAGDVAPDVAMLDPNNFQRFARRGALLPLNQFYGDVPGFSIDDYYQPIVRASSYQGNLYVLPRDIAPIGIVYYNKKLFDEAGIPYPDGSWTWDFKMRPELKEKDFLWVISKLTKFNAKGKAYQWGISAAWPGAMVDAFVYSLGARYGDDLERPRKLGYTDPRTVQAYQFVSDLMLKDQYMPSPSELTSGLGSNSLQVFMQGKVAMHVSGIWDTPVVRETVAPGKPAFFEWDICKMPAYKDGTLWIPTGGSGYSVLSSTKYPKEAWLLTQWMAGEHGMLAMAKAGIAQPAIRKFALQEPWIPGPNTPKDQQYPHNRIITDQLVPNVVFTPTADFWSEISGLANSPLDTIWSGTALPAAALKEAQDRASTRLTNILNDRERPPYNWSLSLVFGGILLAAVLWFVYGPERKVKYTTREKRESRIAYLFILPWILGMLIFTLGPMVFSLLLSLADWDVITPAKWRGLENFHEAFTVDPRFYKVLSVTTIYTVVAVPLGVLGSMLLALLLNAKVRGIAIYRTCFYLPSLASAVAASLIWKRIFQQDGGLLNLIIYGPNGDGNFLGLATFLSHYAPAHQQMNWLGLESSALPSIILMSVWGVGGGMIILLAGLQGIPNFYYEAALLDGAGVWHRFKSVTLPLLTPSLFFSMITGMIGAFQVFAQSFVMTAGGPNDSTRFYMLHLYEAGFKDLRMGYASALAWILFAVILFFTALQWRLQKYVYYESEAR